MTTLQSLQRREMQICAGFAGVLLAFVFFYATAPITDPDFWWHLKSGEMMVQTGGLLQSDPFTFTADGVTSTREALILKGYWLWQLSAYGLYSLLGFNGIFLLNFLTGLAIVGVVARQMWRQKVDYALAILLMALGFYLLRSVYLLERPQVISLLFASILLGFLAWVREGGQLDWRLPLLMMVWANLHGGYVVGDLILVCFAVGAVVEYRRDLPRLRHLLLWIGTGIGASLLSPSGVLPFVELLTFHNSALMTGISEYQSTWIKFNQGSWSMAILWLLIVLYGIGIWRARRFYWPELVVALFLAYFSVAYLRNVGFFAVAMLPGIGFYLQQAFSPPPLTGGGWGVGEGAGLVSATGLPPHPSPPPQGGRGLYNRRAKGLQYLVVALSSALLLWQVNVDRSRTGTLSPIYPVESTQFIQTSGLQGKMFNGYTFGGYLLWKLYPQHLVFIDGRVLDADVYRDWNLITSASLKDVGGRKEFEVLLDRYGIDYVVQSHIFHDTGRLTPLLKFLLIRPEWIPVYIDQQSYILVRNSQKNAAVIERYRLDKGDFNNNVVDHLKSLCIDSPKDVVNQVALAEMLLFVGRYAEAEERLETIARLQANNPTLPSLRNQLAVLKRNRK